MSEHKDFLFWDDEVRYLKERIAYLTAEVARLREALKIQSDALLDLIHEVDCARRDGYTGFDEQPMGGEGPILRSARAALAPAPETAQGEEGK